MHHSSFVCTLLSQGNLSVSLSLPLSVSTMQVPYSMGKMDDSRRALGGEQRESSTVM